MFNRNIPVMPKITDYSFLFQQMYGTKSNAGMVNPLKVSDLSNGSLRTQLKAVGTDIEVLGILGTVFV